MPQRGVTKPTAGEGLRRRRAARSMQERFGTRTGFPERFWQHVRIDPAPDACWVYRSGRPDDDYGQFDKVGAHRIAYWLDTGVDPTARMVLHHCDNPPCVRPSHLYLGGNSENMQDRTRRGRFVQKGQGRGARRAKGVGVRRKLTDEQVAALRAQYATGEVTQRALAADYGISPGYLSTLVNGLYR